MKTNIKDFFNEKKWELGEQLYDNKRVSSPSTAPDYSSIFLVQDGCQICKVSISMNPITMSCSCNDGKKGFRCKHMAAAFIAYEKKGDTTFDHTYHIKNYEDCAWYPITQKYTSSRYPKLMQFLNNHTTGREDFVYDEILSLISFLLKDDPIHYHVFDYGIRNLKDLRDTLGPNTYIELDSRLLMVLKNIHDQEIHKIIFHAYFYSQNAYPSLKQFIEMDHENKEIDFVNQIINLNKRFYLPEEEISQLIEPYFNNIEICLWLSDYYFKQEQPDKVQNLLEAYLKNHNYELEKHRDILLPLFKAYLMNNQIDEAFDFFYKIIRIDFIPASTVYSILKNHLDEETWKLRGKPTLINWTENITPIDRYYIYLEINEPDLLLFNANQFMILSQLYKCFDMIYDYDQGATLSLLKKCMIMDYTYRETTSNNYETLWKEFHDNLPLSNPEFILSLKQILIELRTERTNMENLINYLEDRLYEREQ